MAIKHPLLNWIIFIYYFSKKGGNSSNPLDKCEQTGESDYSLLGSERAF